MDAFDIGIRLAFEKLAMGVVPKTFNPRGGGQPFRLGALAQHITEHGELPRGVRQRVGEVTHARARRLSELLAKRREHAGSIAKSVNETAAMRSIRPAMQSNPRFRVAGGF